MIGLMSVKDYAKAHPDHHCLIVRNFDGYAVCAQRGGVLEHFSSRSDCMEVLTAAGYELRNRQWVQRKEDCHALGS